MMRVKVKSKPTKMVGETWSKKPEGQVMDKNGRSRRRVQWLC